MEHLKTKKINNHDLPLGGKMELKKITALVPMRHHSQRVPGKNYRPLAGKPLFFHILTTLSRCPEINKIVVDTDSPVIIEKTKADFSDIVIIDRPEHLRADSISMNEILMYDTAQEPSDLFLQTHSTNPLLSAETISRAIQTLRNNYSSYDSLFSVTRFQSRLWDQLARPINHNPSILIQTQDLPPLFEENSCLYLFTRQNLETYHSRIGVRPYLFEISKSEAWDIDEEEDFILTEMLMKMRLKNSLV
jgi:CMP-N-acetylneuraminic acid synthetase